MTEQSGEARAKMEKRQFGKLTLYGPHPLERNSDGHLKHPMADVFPQYNAMVVGSGLHVTLAMDLIAELDRASGDTMGEEEQARVYEDLVALVLRGNRVIVRSTPGNMEHAFRAAELLQELIPADMIRFTGHRDPRVREAFKLRGESWKMTPRYFNAEEIKRQIQLSLVSVGTRNQYYYNMESGGRVVTYQQFGAIRESLVNFQEFRDRIAEVVDLYGRRNKQFVRELDFFMVDHDRFELVLLERLNEYLQRCEHWGDEERRAAAELYEQVMASFRNAVGPEFLGDELENPVWRNQMYSELNNIPPTEERFLGVSEEFNMNILWLPGCRITDGRAIWDPHIEEPVARLLQDFFRFYGELEYINLGRVMRSQNTKRAAGSYREVFIGVLKQSRSLVEQIRILRKVRRNTLYYLNRGFSLERARGLAEGYLQYTLDRRNILSLLGAHTPPLNILSRTEDLPGIGPVEVAFFDRAYIRGLATDKVPDYYFEDRQFVMAQAPLLGEAAGLNLVIGRSDPDTGEVFFSDGDEMLVFDPGSHIPRDLVLADFTGSFADVVSPLGKFEPFYAQYLGDMLCRMRFEGVSRELQLEVAELFMGAMRRWIETLREMVFTAGATGEMIGAMLEDRNVEVNPIKVKWEKTLRRLEQFKLDSFMERMRSDICRRVGIC